MTLEELYVKAGPPPLPEKQADGRTPSALSLLTSACGCATFPCPHDTATPMVAMRVEVVDDDDEFDCDVEQEDFDNAIGELKQCYRFLDDLITGYLLDKINLDKSTIIDLEIRANAIHEFINTYEVWLPRTANSSARTVDAILRKS